MRLVGEMSLEKMQQSCGTSSVCLRTQYPVRPDGFVQDRGGFIPALRRNDGQHKARHHSTVFHKNKFFYCFHAEFSKSNYEISGVLFCSVSSILKIHEAKSTSGNRFNLDKRINLSRTFTDWRGPPQMFRRSELLM